MAIHRVFIHEGQKPPASAIAEAERASRMPINFEDAPEMTEEQAAHEFLNDFIGSVLWYADMNEFATDFNNGCIKPGVFFVKIYN